MKTSEPATAAIILPFGGRPITTKAIGVVTEADYCLGPRGLAGMARRRLAFPVGTGVSRVSCDAH
jgi:hypothetical protein